MCIFRKCTDNVVDTWKKINTINGIRPLSVLSTRVSGMNFHSIGKRLVVHFVTKFQRSPVLYGATGQKLCVFKGRWKRETMRVGKESNVRYWSRTVAIEVYFQLEHAVFE